MPARLRGERDSVLFHPPTTTCGRISCRSSVLPRLVDHTQLLHGTTGWNTTKGTTSGTRNPVLMSSYPADHVTKNYFSTITYMWKT